MTDNPTPEPPKHSLLVASFAENLAKRYTDLGGDTNTLFAAFAGLVSARDQRVCADCLTALEGSIDERAMRSRA